MTMRTRLAQFFEGRNGIDNLNVAIMWLAVLTLVASYLVPHDPGKWILHSSASFFILAYCARALSRNLQRRYAENARFLNAIGRLKNNWESRRVRAEQRKEYKIFKCPSCGMKLRVPRGKGKVMITCRQCGAQFQEKS